MNMKRRYYLIIFIVLFAASLWGLFHTITANIPAPAPLQTVSKPLPPEVPAPPPSTGNAQTGQQ